MRLLVPILVACGGAPPAPEPSPPPPPPAETPPLPAGPRRVVEGVVEAEAAAEVDVDVRGAGGEFLHKEKLAAPGAFRLALPAALGQVTLEFFQDLDGGGPGPGDPFARIAVDLGAAVPPVSVRLRRGAWGPNPRTGEPAGGGGGPFPDPGPAPVLVSGHVRDPQGLVPPGGLVDLDVFVQDPGGPGGRRYAGKRKVAVGPFSFQAPRRGGVIEIEAFYDRGGDGPSPGDPWGRCTANPIILGDEPVEDLLIDLAPTGATSGGP